MPKPTPYVYCWNGDWRFPFCRDVAHNVSTMVRTQRVAPYRNIQTMDIDHCLTVQQDLEGAKFTRAADKTLTQRLLYVSSPAFHPSGASVRTTVQKYDFFGIATRLCFFFRTPLHKKCTESVAWFIRNYVIFGGYGWTIIDSISVTIFFFVFRINYPKKMYFCNRKK